jgi:LDH2 family malate/lactate/ureidoglycolate dehydrogenase
MDMKIEDARQLAIDVLTRHGMADDHARIVADHLVDAAMVGREFASLPRVLVLIDNIKKRPPAKPITVVREDDRFALLDGGDTNGYVTSIIGMDKATEKARQHGVGIVAINNSWYSGRLAYYVERAARADMIAFHTVNTTGRVAAHGSIDRLFGTNPIAFAFPSATEPLVIDFGTSTTTWGEVHLRQRTGKPLEPDWAVDVDGNPTTDPTAALEGAILPWGGARGSGLLLVSQVFGILAGSKVVIEDISNFGFFFLALDPGMFMPREEFKAKVSEMMRNVTESRPRPDFGKVRLPNQTSSANRQAALKRGTIHVDEKVYAALQAALK